jgi:hypothetical protein
MHSSLSTVMFAVQCSSDERLKGEESRRGTQENKAGSRVGYLPSADSTPLTSVGRPESMMTAGERAR